MLPSFILEYFWWPVWPLTLFTAKASNYCQSWVKWPLSRPHSVPCGLNGLIPVFKQHCIVHLVYIRPWSTELLCWDVCVSWLNVLLLWPQHVFMRCLSVAPSPLWRSTSIHHTYPSTILLSQNYLENNQNGSPAIKWNDMTSCGILWIVKSNWKLLGISLKNP